MSDLRDGLCRLGSEWGVSLEHRTAERRADERTDRGVAERRVGERRARATAGLALVMAAVRASATADPAGLDTGAHAPAALEPNAAGSTERLETAVGLWPSLNSKFDVHIEDAATRHGVSQELVRAVIQVESGFDRPAVSPAGTRGADAAHAGHGPRSELRL
jgi:soluble lytic murein transglycosylase-like protein